MQSGPNTRAKLRQQRDATARMVAVMLDHSKEDFESILKDGPDLQAPCLQNYPALAWAVKQGNQAWVDLLLQYGATDEQFVDPNTAEYIHASDCGRIEDEARVRRDPALFSAILNKDYKQVKALLEQGADVNAGLRRRNASRFPLQEALKQNDVKMLKLLLDHNADLSVLDDMLLGILPLSTEITPEVFDFLAKQVDKQELALVPTAKALLDKIKVHCEQAQQMGKKPIILLGEVHGTKNLHTLEKMIVAYAQQTKLLEKAYIELPHDASRLTHKFMITSWELQNISIEPIDEGKLGLVSTLVAKVMGKDTYYDDVRSLKGGAREAWLDRRDRFMADKINTYNQSAVHITGSAHLQGLMRYIDREKFHVLPINITRVQENLLGGYLYAHFQNRLQHIIEGRNAGLERYAFANDAQKVLQATYIPQAALDKKQSNKRRRDDEDDIVFTSQKSQRTDNTVIVPSFSLQRKNSHTVAYYTTQAAMTCVKTCAKSIAVAQQAFSYCCPTWLKPSGY